MGGCAFLPSYRKTFERARYGDRDQVSPRAVSPVPPDGSFRDAFELPGAADSTGGGHQPGNRDESAGAEDGVGARGYGFPLRRLFRQGAPHRIRDVTLRLHDRRQNPVPTRGHDRERLVRNRAGPELMGSRTDEEFSELRLWKRGPARGR